jgi:hypothetical protein
MSIKEEIDSFKNAAWKDSKPLLYAMNYAEYLIKENYRMRAIMLEALKQIDNNLDSHIKNDEVLDSKLFQLLDNLCFKRRDEYFMSSEDFVADLREKLNFDNFEK